MIAQNITEDFYRNKVEPGSQMNTGIDNKLNQLPQ